MNKPLCVLQHESHVGLGSLAPWLERLGRPWRVRDLCCNQAFRHGRAAYGVQFHFEMTAAMIDDWAAGDNACAALAARHGVDCESLAAATARHLPAMQAMAATMLQRFVRLCGRAVINESTHPTNGVLH